MCIGGTFDTLNAVEQMFLSRAAAADFPTHRFSLESNEDGIVWAVLAPHGRGDVRPRVIICRVDPCVTVMIEDQHARRQFRSLSTVAEAVDFVRAMSDQLLSAAAGFHQAQSVLH